MDAKDLVTKDARANQKHYINTKLVDIIEYRQSRKWYVSIAVVGLFSIILGLMIIFMLQGKELQEYFIEVAPGNAGTPYVAGILILFFLLSLRIRKS